MKPKMRSAIIGRPEAPFVNATMGVRSRVDPIVKDLNVLLSPQGRKCQPRKRHRRDSKIAAHTEEAFLDVFAPGAVSGLRYPENHLVRLGI